MDLYVGNATKQVVSFAYLPVDPRSVDRNIDRVPSHRFQTIPIGGQIKVSGDLAEGQVNYILEQHETYGIVAHDEIDRVKGQVTLVYSIDHQIKAAAIEKAIKHNADLLVQRGKQIRHEAAIANNTILEQSLEDGSRRETLAKLEVSVTEENHDPRDNTPPISDGFRVVKGAKPEQSARASRRAQN